MNVRSLSIVVTGIVLLLLAAGVAGAFTQRASAAEAVEAAQTPSTISYQGRLTDPDGQPLDGNYTMRFIVYDAANGGSALWDSGNRNISVDNGLFTTRLGVDQANFNGQALWLSIDVNGQTLSPRQEILPAPYAIGLRPGADIIAESLDAADAALAGYAPATGAALYASAGGGAGLHSQSGQSYGVWGASADSWGGYFTSDNGYGLRVHTNGNDHYDHGAYVTSTGGYGVYAQSEQNQGVRGEAGNVEGIAQPLGAVGVVGIGANRGVYGGSSSGNGLYGVSETNYGIWGQSADWRGVTGRTSRTDNNYGLYTSDNLYSLNYHAAGAFMQVMQYSGAGTVSPGDVVVFSGIDRAAAVVDGPVVQVTKATFANSTAVAGVVYSRFNIAAVDPALESPDGSLPAAMTNMEVTPPGDAAPGEYVLVVVQGPALVKASAVDAGAIQPGDLLSTAGAAGLAAKAQTTTVDGSLTSLPGTVFGKALEPLDGKQDMIYVYVTLQ